VIERLVLFGASGDLTGRFLLPAFGALHAQGRLPDGFQVLGAATEDWDDEGFRRFAAERLEAHAPDLATASREAVAGMLRNRPVDVADAQSVAGLLDADESLAAYLALPQGLFATTVQNIVSAGLPGGSRVALEKPFGEDLQSARQLNELLHSTFGEDAEKTVFRVDHVLGMPTVQNLRFWSGQRIEEVEVLWEETLALEGRAGFYDRAGALRDVMQNHMMQLLALVAMDPLASGAGDDLRDAKVAALHAVRPLAPEHVERCTQRARYEGYVEEEGVDPARCTETFAELLLELDMPRWKGTRFRLRAGKALARRRKGVVLHLRPADRESPGDELRIEIDDSEDATAYPSVLLDLLSGGNSLSVRGDEAEEAWRIVDPVLDAWRDDRVPMRDYAAGSDGPPRL
jgi:glucose-6-phosphate 1-dehydrogenase